MDNFLRGFSVGFIASKFEPEELKPVSTSDSTNNYIKIWDIPIEGPFSAQLPEIIASVRKRSEVATTLSGLDENAQGTIRVVVEEANGDFTSVNRLPDHTNCDRGFRALISQWRQPGTKWFEAESFDFFESPEPLQSVSKGVKMLRELIGKVANSRHKWARTSRNMLICKPGYQQGLVFISCKTFASKKALNRLGSRATGSPFFLTDKFAEELRELEPIYGPIRTKNNWVQLFSLQCCHANMNLFSDFLQRLRTSYVQSRKLHFDPRIFKLRRWLMTEIINDSYLYRQFNSCGSEMTATLESLLDVLTALPESHKHSPGPGFDHAAEVLTLESLIPVIREAAGTAPAKGELLILEKEIRSCCKDINLRLSTLSADLEHDLGFLDLSRNINQTIGVQQLTILATIFLPMSLATGLLSMGTRFRDLGSLLYDFFGVLILVVTFVLLILVGLNLLDALREQSGMEKNKIFRWLRPVILGLIAVPFLVYWSLVLSSFLVGMFDDVVLGVKILGFGTAVILGIPLLFVVLSWLLTILDSFVQKVHGRIRAVGSSSKKDEGKQQETLKQKQKQSDPEGGIFEATQTPLKDNGPLQHPKEKFQESQSAVTAERRSAIGADAF